MNHQKSLRTLLPLRVGNDSKKKQSSFEFPIPLPIPSEISEKRMSDSPIPIPSKFKGINIADFEIRFCILIEMFVTSISFRRTFKSFWDFTGKSTILVKSALL